MNLSTSLGSFLLCTLVRVYLHSPSGAEPLSTCEQIAIVPREFTRLKEGRGRAPHLHSNFFFYPRDPIVMREMQCGHTVQPRSTCSFLIPTPTRLPFRLAAPNIGGW